MCSLVVSENLPLVTRPDFFMGSENPKLLMSNFGFKWLQLGKFLPLWPCFTE